MNIKYFIAGAMLAALSPAVYAALPNTSLSVIPLPREVSEQKAAEGFTLAPDTPVLGVPGLENEAGLLRGYISQLPAAKPSGKITLRADLPSDNPEAYTLRVTPDGITVNGASPAGLFYGIQTIRKAALGAPAGEPAVIPSGTVSDAPRFAYRGAMLDVARHFFNSDEVKRFIDMMALHNLNTFHWHLTDNQGWRIESKKYPLLTEIGSHRDSTIIGHTDKYDNIPVDGYFTQEQAREIVDYAAKRHINVIPEIDLPGHMTAALAAYPQFGCTGGPYEVWCHWGLSDEILCAGNDSTLQFIDDVLNEIMDIFPSEYIHIGGDEAPKTAWEKCPKCQQRIKQEGITPTDKFTAEQRLQGFITSRAAATIGARGRKMIGWDEILEGEIPLSSVIMSWRGIDGATQGVKKGHPVILSPNTYFYFDYYQSRDIDREPVALGGYNSVDRAYTFDPTKGMTPEEAARVLGPQANLWTEYIKDFGYVEYMELPRMSALAEVAWTPLERKDYADFLNRMPAMWRAYDRFGYNYARHLADVTPTFKPDIDARQLRVSLASIGGAEIRYTLDGSDPFDEKGSPAPASRLYSGPFAISSSCTLKTAAKTLGKVGRVNTDEIFVNPATFAKVEIDAPFARNYAYDGPQTLTDGLSGNPNFRTGRWVGFNNQDPVITLSLPETATVSSLTFNNSINMGEWVADATGYRVEGAVGADGTWFPLAEGIIPERLESDKKTDVSTHEIRFNAPVEVDRVRLTVKSTRSLPAWHRGAGKPAHMFLDEIILK